MIAPEGLDAVQAGPSHTDPEGRELFELISSYLKPEECYRAQEALELARLEHGEQRRKSGELFFTHPLTVAYYLAEYRLDAAALMAALLHDLAEDTLVSIEQIERRFGPEVSRLVDGVTKLKEVTAGIARGRQLTPQEIQDASLLKMFEAMTADVRVVLIKLFDRLHNMRTIRALPAHKQEEKARETLAVYAPLANRLGIWRLKTELEALSFQVIDPHTYQRIKRQLEYHFHKQQRAYATVSKEIFTSLQEQGLKVVNVLPSPLSIYSTYRRMAAQSAPFDNVESPLRVVVLFEDVPSCYLALGYLHQNWRPVPGKFDDYIALPRENLYRALHTTVIYSDGQPLKVRFRSVAMNEVSEIGVLARWVYAGTPMWTRGIAERVEALFENISENIRLEPLDASSGVKSVVEDVFGEQVMIYTPRGDIIELPQGSTPVDFAYAIHTEVGNQCQGAVVNEKPYPLNRPLSDGDQVRIVKSGWATPQRHWLDEDLGFIATGRARARVRRWFRRLSDRQAMDEGRKLLQFELTMLGMADRSHQRVAEQLGLQYTDELYHALGRADMLPTEVAATILAQEWHQEPSRRTGRTVRGPAGQEYVISYARGRDLRLCRACKAQPGDRIIGFLRSDRGLTIHREGCYTLRPDPMADRTIRLSWGKAENEVRPVRLGIDVYDRTGLLFDIAELLQAEHVNVTSIHTVPVDDDGTVRLVLELEAAAPRQLVRILHRAQALVNVYSVTVLPGQSRRASTPADRYLPE